MNLKRRVRFQPEIATIVHTSGVSVMRLEKQEERDATALDVWSTTQTDSSVRWYSQQEIDLIVADALKTAQDSNDRNQHTQQTEEDEQFGSRYIREGVMREDGQSKLVRRNRYDHIEISQMRGLELLHDLESTYAKQRKAVIAQFPRCVLQEQSRQRRLGVFNQDKLAKASSVFSGFSAAYAAKFGLEDERDAILHYSDWYRHQKSHSSSRRA